MRLILFILLTCLACLRMGFFLLRRCCCAECCFASVDVTFAGVAASNQCMADSSKCTALTGFNDTYTLPLDGTCTGPAVGTVTYTETFAYTGAHYDVYTLAACGGAVLEEWESTHVEIIVTIDRATCEVTLVRATLILTCTVGAGNFEPDAHICFQHAAFPVGSGPTALGDPGDNDIDPALNPGDGGTATVIETP